MDTEYAYWLAEQTASYNPSFLIDLQKDVSNLLGPWDAAFPNIYVLFPDTASFSGDLRPFLSVYRGETTFLFHLVYDLNLGSCRLVTNLKYDLQFSWGLPVEFPSPDRTGIEGLYEDYSTLKHFKESLLSRVKAYLNSREFKARLGFSVTLGV